MIKIGSPRTRAPRNAAGPGGFGMAKGRLIIGLIVAAFAVFSYFASSEYNPITDEEQRLSISPEQEIALGLQARNEMIGEFGGLDNDAFGQNCVKDVGARLVQMGVINGQSIANLPWEYEFHLLRDPNTVNAFALPGGQIFITRALFDRLETEAQLAGVLGHEIGHVIARHSAQRISQQQLTQGLLGAVVTASGSASSAQIGQMVAQMITMQYGRGDELQSDNLGVKIMGDAGYDPRTLTEVMEILASASGGERQPEFMSTHPNPDNRIQEIQQAVQEEYPGGVPDNLADDERIIC